MSSYKQLSAQIAALMQQAEAMQKVEVASVIAEIKAKMAEFGITAEDLREAGPRGKRKGGVVAAKYRNAATGETWTGRGKPPRWMAAQLLAGKTKEDFLIP